MRNLNTSLAKRGISGRSLKEKKALLDLKEKEDSIAVGLESIVAPLEYPSFEAVAETVYHLYYTKVKI